MSYCVEVPAKIWKDVYTFFEVLVRPCKECIWGNPLQCWRSECAAFQYRPIARDVMSVQNSGRKPMSMPKHISIENEILQALKGYDRPVSPADIKLWTTNSKSVKSKTITRLIRKGFIKEERIGKYTRCISLTPKGRQ